MAGLLRVKPEKGGDMPQFKVDDRITAITDTRKRANGKDAIDIPATITRLRAVSTQRQERYYYDIRLDAVGEVITTMAEVDLKAV